MLISFLGKQLSQVSFYTDHVLPFVAFGKAFSFSSEERSRWYFLKKLLDKNEFKMSMWAMDTEGGASDCNNWLGVVFMQITQ